MRSFFLLLMLAIFGGVVFLVFSTEAQTDPAQEATKFLTLVQSNQYEAALGEFGDNTCHCAPKGGYVAYLRYDRQHDPNLAFLRGQQFEMGKPTVKTLPYNGEKYVFPWDKPEDVVVYVPLQFKDPAKRPYFLPTDMAFGYEMPEKDLQAFIADPTQKWMRAFTMRLRPNLEPGLVPPPDKNAKPEEGEEQIDESLLPPEVVKYLHAKDAAGIKLASGNTVPATTIEQKLPRLEAITVGLKIVRRGTYHRWAIKKIGIQDPVVVSDGHEFKLVEPKTDSQSFNQKVQPTSVELSGSSKPAVNKPVNQPTSTTR